MKKLRFYLLFLLLALCLLPLGVGNAQAKYVKTITLAPVDIQIDGSYSVTYHGNNGYFGSAAVTTNVVYYKPGTNDVVSGSVKNPTWADHVFLGLWYKDPGCTDPFDPANDPQNLTGNIDVYARFVGKSRGLVSGTTFRDRIASGKYRNENLNKATHIVFTDKVGPSDAVDFSSAGDGGVVAWLDGTTCYVSTQRSGTSNEIILNWDCSYMFKNNGKVKKVTFGHINSSSVTTIAEMFSFSGTTPVLTTVENFAEFKDAKLENMNQFANGCSSLKTIDVSMLNVSAIKTFQFAFNGCKSLQELDVSKWNTSRATGFNYFFTGCSSLKTLDVSGFNTSNGTVFYQMFGGCSSLTTLDVSGFNTAKATDMRYMFSGCSSLKSLDLTNFNTASVTTGMYGMFQNCSSLTTLDLSSFNTAKVQSMSYMFNGTKNLTTIYVSTGWSTAGLTKYTSGDNVGELQDTNMFWDCPKLVGGMGTARANYGQADGSRFWKSEMAKIDGGPSSPGYFTDIADKDTELLSLTGENGTYTGIQ